MQTTKKLKDQKHLKMLNDKKVGALPLGIHLFLFLIYVSPLNYLKAIQELLLAGAMYIATGAMVFIIISQLIKKRFIQAIILFILSAGLVFLDFQAYEIRKEVLNKTIQSFYCPIGNNNEEILGGIQVIGDGETVFFENSTHCSLSVCKEEHFHCS